MNPPAKINIFFKEVTGSTRCFQVEPNPTREVFKELALRMLPDLSQFRFVISSKQIDFTDDQTFERTRHLLTDNCNIFILMRMLGGLEPGALYDIVVMEANNVLNSVPKETHECVICGEDELCVFICCAWVCPEQVLHNFKNYDARYKCHGSSESPACGKTHDLGVVFNSPMLSATIRQLHETLELTRNADFQICKCGHFLVNETLYAQQQCHRCVPSRRFCFFCNKDWQPGMANHKYYCSDACELKNKLSYELEELAFDKSVKVPSRRCCPFCFAWGGYDMKCKYHKCGKCNKSFCFICLKEEAECKRVYKSNYKHKCTDIVKQNFSDLPHLLTH